MCYMSATIDELRKQALAAAVREDEESKVPLPEPKPEPAPPVIDVHARVTVGRNLLTVQCAVQGMHMGTHTIEDFNQVGAALQGALQTAAVLVLAGKQ